MVCILAIRNYSTWASKALKQNIATPVVASFPHALSLAHRFVTLNLYATSYRVFLSPTQLKAVSLSRKTNVDKDGGTDPRWSEVRNKPAKGGTTSLPLCLSISY